MKPSAAAVAHRKANEVYIVRSFDVPIESVFDAWVDRDRLLEWYAPHGCAVKFGAGEIREGATQQFSIVTPDGKFCRSKAEYVEISRPTKLVLKMIIADETGATSDAVTAGMDSAWPTETTVTVNFESQGAGTKLTLHQTVDEALAKRTGAYPSWLQMFDRLAKLVAE